MKLQFMAALAASILAMAGTAQAQQGNPTGQWYCEMGFRDTAPGRPPNPVGMQFQIAVYGNGSAEGQGYDMGSSGSFPFQFRAQWGLQGRRFQVQGQKSSVMGMGPGQFVFESNLTGPNTMAFTETSQTGQVYASQCQRQG